MLSKSGAIFSGVAVGTSNFLSAAGSLPASINVAALDARFRAGLSGPAPTAVDDAASMTTGTITIAVTANDTDADGSLPHVISVTQGAGGSVVIGADGKVTYKAKLGFIGNDSFRYTIIDDHGGTATATVSISALAAPVSRHDFARIEPVPSALSALLDGAIPPPISGTPQPVFPGPSIPPAPASPPGNLIDSFPRAAVARHPHGPRWVRGMHKVEHNQSSREHESPIHHTLAAVTEHDSKKPRSVYRRANSTTS
jgi:hypothetical protein